MATTDSSSDEQVTLTRLRTTVCNIDALSQEGLSEISAVAKLALAWLEKPDGYDHLDVVAKALHAIWRSADDTVKYISDEAESVGCNHVDEHEGRRVAAWAAHHGLRCVNV